MYNRLVPSLATRRFDCRCYKVFKIELNRLLAGNFKILLSQFRFLSTVELQEQERKICIDMCMDFHTSTQLLSDQFLVRLNRHNYVTPTSYLELIHTFKSLLDKKRTWVYANVCVLKRNMCISVKNIRDNIFMHVSRIDLHFACQ